MIYISSSNICELNLLVVCSKKIPSQNVDAHKGFYMHSKNGNTMVKNAHREERKRIAHFLILFLVSN